jgi:nitroreductase
MPSPYLEKPVRSKERAIKDQLHDLYAERRRLEQAKYEAECGDDMAFTNGKIPAVNSALADVNRRIRQLEAEQGEGA